MRLLKTALGTALWFSTTAVVMSASFVPAVAPSDVGDWRLILGVPALALGIITAIIGPRLSERAFEAWVDFCMIPALAVNLVLLQITPATEAILFNLVVTLVFAGYFLRPRVLLLTFFGGAAIAISALFTEPASQTPHLGSFLVVYLATVAMTVALIHLQNTETLGALDEVRRRGLTDPLTGLANLRALEREAEKRFASGGFGKNRRGVTGLILIDLDNFKSANSAHGHIGGDYALKMVAEQLARIAMRDAVVARVGGDEFAVLLRAESHARIEQTGEIYRGAVRAAGALIDIPGFEIDSAIGTAVYPDDGGNLSELLDVADRSMYASKGNKRHTVPDLERAAEKTALRPAWLDEPEANEDDGVTQTTYDLDWATGGSIEFLASRTMYSRSSAFAWAIGSLVLGISLLVPGAYPDPTMTWWMAMIGGIVLAPLILLLNATPQTRTHLVLDLVSLVGLAGVIALTGGIQSTAPPLLILLVASQAWFWGTRLLALRLIGPLLVAASPILYTDLTGSNSDVIALVGIYTLGALLVTTVCAMYFNRRMLTRLQSDAERLAMSDPLTGISNRRCFNQYVQSHLGAEEPEEFAIVMIDLDNFKRVNTERGHRAGDEVLRAIANALGSVAREDDCVARVGGDEFAAVLPGVGVDGARALAERFVKAVAETPEAVESNVGASAGFALFPLHGRTLDQLVFTADSALMAVKASGKGSARVARIVSAVG